MVFVEVPEAPMAPSEKREIKKLAERAAEQPTKPEKTRTKTKTESTLATGCSMETQGGTEVNFDMDPADAKRLVKISEHYLGKTSTPLQKNNHLIPMLNVDNLLIGPLIGMGGFGLVRTVQVVPRKPNPNKTKPPRTYVLKTLVPRTTTEKMAAGVIHLVRERYFLTRLHHPHIVKLQAVSEGGLESITEYSRLDAYFLLLEYLPQTLCHRMQQWEEKLQKAHQQQRRGWTKFLSSGGSISHKLEKCPSVYKEQLKVAIQVASALVYLHEQRIIYRDLKPANIGFNTKGRLKLFDFGLATQLEKSSDLDSTHDYLSGRVGTTRYMSTEVLRKQPYNVKADVFSFSILLWEILTLEKPFLDMPEAALYGERPEIPSVWPAPLKRIMERGWSDHLRDRPHVMEFQYVLKDLWRHYEEQQEQRKAKSSSKQQAEKGR